MKYYQTTPLVFAVAITFTSCKTVVEKWSPGGGTPSAPASFKNGTKSGGKSTVDTGKWWKEFEDSTLNELMNDVEDYNPDVAAALARVDQANAFLGITGARRFPGVTGAGSFNSDRDSPNTLRFPIDAVEFDRYRVAVNASWEIDLWGRVRGTYQREKFNAAAAKNDYDNVLLSLRATLGRQYFALRFAERDAAILRDAVDVRKEALRLQNARADRGAGTDIDVARAKTELDTVLVDLQGIDRTIGKLENSIATLTGRAPSEFNLSKRSSTPHVPTFPAGIPSELLERRPDLLAAKNALLAASREVGITKASFLPRITLTGTGGQASLRSTNLFAGKDSFFYSLGPQLDVPLFQAGNKKSTVAEAVAKWNEAAEKYRSALLTAVQEVDDSLLDLQILRKQTATQRRASKSAADATSLATTRFDQGAASYFEVIDAQRTALEVRRRANALDSEQMAATVQLIQALGGSW